MHFSLEHLRAFVAAAQEGSFSAAARKLGKAQSAVSTAVIDLEIDLGVELFDRSGRTPVLTAKGESLVIDATLILGRCREMEQKAANMAGGVEPKLTLVVDDFVPLRFFEDLLIRFSDQFPDVELEILFGALGDTDTLVESGRADVGMMARKEPGVGNFRRIATVGQIPVVDAGHPLADKKRISAAELEEQRELLITSRGGERVVRNEFLGRNAWWIESYYLIFDLVRRGLGWAFLPEPMIIEDLKKGRLVRLPLDFQTTGLVLPVYIVWSRSRRLGPAGQWLLTQMGELPF